MPQIIYAFILMILVTSGAIKYRDARKNADLNECIHTKINELKHCDERGIAEEACYFRFEYKFPEEYNKIKNTCEQNLKKKKNKGK